MELIITAAVLLLCREYTKLRLKSKKGDYYGEQNDKISD